MTDMRSYLAGRPSAGPIQAGDIVMILRNVSGTLTWLKGEPGRIGYAPYKAWVADDVPNAIKFYNKDLDRGYVIGNEGPDAAIIQVPNYAVDPIDKDANYGKPLFYVERTGDGMIAVNGAPGTNLRPGPEDPAPNPVAAAANLTGLTGAVVGDCAYATAEGRYYCLTTTGPTTLGHWTALPIGAPGLMTVIYTFEGEIEKDDMPVMCMFKGPNKLVVG